ncbi:hypothetical protein [Clostridium sulfidigenes]|uniref:hypothetical protein n=1 Tax=Clostridium sulfidigenes TaxID=318464 RepID=UPI003F8C91BD
MSTHYEYRNKKTGEVLRLEDLQEKYNLGFAQKELWDIVEANYTTKEVHTTCVEEGILFED